MKDFLRPAVIASACLLASPAFAFTVNVFTEGEPRSSDDVAPSDSNAQGDLGRDLTNAVILPNGSFIQNDYFGTLGAGFYGFTGGLAVDCAAGPNGNDCLGDTNDPFTFSLASGFEVTNVTFSSIFDLTSAAEAFDSFGFTVSQNQAGFGSVRLGSFVDRWTTLSLGQRFDVDPVLGEQDVPGKLTEGVFTFSPFLDAPQQGAAEGVGTLRWSIGVTVVDTNPQISTVPVPAAGWLLLAGFGMLGAAARRRTD